jgi:hypothetical protein
MIIVRLAAHFSGRRDVDFAQIPSKNAAKSDWIERVSFPVK